MISDEARQIIAQKWEERNAPKRELNVWRDEWTAQSAEDPLPVGTQIEPLHFGDVFCERVSVGKVADDAVCFFPHGGGYLAGNCITHRKMAAHFSMRSGLAVILPDYRLAPEYPFPAGLNDTMAAYEGVVNSGIEPKRIVLMGDSAGGGMALALMLELRDAGSELPRAAILMSPWTDIEAGSPSYQTNVELDPSIEPEGLRDAGRQYVGDASPTHPYISPIHADLTGLPQMLVQVGALEVMLDDSVVLAERAREKGVKVDLDVWSGLWHVWQSHVPDLPEANQAMDRMAEFARAALGLTR